MFSFLLLVRLTYYVDWLNRYFPVYKEHISQFQSIPNKPGLLKTKGKDIKTIYHRFCVHFEGHRPSKVILANKKSIVLVESVDDPPFGVIYQFSKKPCE